MAVNPNVRGHGGAWDIVLEKQLTSERMGFLTTAPHVIEQINNAAPAVSVGGDPAYSNEAWQQIVITDFATGGDRLRFETSDRRYQWSDGEVALHIPDRVVLASKWNNIAGFTGETCTARQILDFSPSTGAYEIRVVMGTGTKLKVYHTSSGSTPNALPGGVAFAGNVKHLFCNDQYMFIALGASGSYRWTGQTVTAGFTSLAVNADCFGWYQEVLYRGLGSTLYVATNNDGSAWSATTHQVGWPSTTISDMYEYANMLVLAKPEGLYGWDGTNVVLLHPFLETRSTYNGAFGCGWHGAIYFPELATVQKGAMVNGLLTAVQDVTPIMSGTQAKERYNHGTMIRAFATPHRLVAAFTGGEGTYPEVLSYNEIGWHQLYRGTSGTMNAAGFSRVQDWIVINVGSETYYKRVTNAGDGEYPDWDSVTGEFYTPAYDAGKPDEFKLWHSIRFRALNLSELLTCSVYYRVDGGSWTQAGSTLIESPANPDLMVDIVLDSTNRMVSGKKIEFRFVLANGGAGATLTPELRGPFVVRYVSVPLTYDQLRMTLQLDENAPLRNGLGTVGGGVVANTAGAGYTVPQMRGFIGSIRNTTSAIILTDEWGTRHYVRLVNMIDIGRRQNTDNIIEEWREVTLTFLTLGQGVIKIDLAGPTLYGVTGQKLANGGLTTLGLAEAALGWPNSYVLMLGTGTQNFAVGLTSLAALMADTTNLTLSTIGSVKVLKGVIPHDENVGTITEWGVRQTVGSGNNLMAYGTFENQFAKTAADSFLFDITVPGS
jgi:hypothetical protein